MSRKRDDDRIDVQDIEFEWYPPKALSNLKKHDVLFQEASTVFGDRKMLNLPVREHRMTPERWHQRLQSV